MQLLAELDTFRKPKKDTLNNQSNIGGMLVLITIGLWCVYATYTVVEYLNTPDKITTDIIPSSTLDNNLAVFSMNNTAHAEVYFLPKMGNGRCDITSNAQIWKHYQIDWEGANYTNEPERVLCPASAGKAMFGFDSKSREVSIPNGIVMLYTISDIALWDTVMRQEIGTDHAYSILYSRNTSLAHTNMFTVGTANQLIPVSYLEGIPDVTGMFEAPPGCINFPITVVTLSFQHTIDMVAGVNRTEILAMELQSHWATIRYQDADGAPWSNMLTPCYAQGMNCIFEMSPDGYANLNMLSTYLHGHFALNDTAYMGFGGLGLIDLVSAATTVQVTVTLGRLPLTTMLGGLGGGFGAMMSGAGVVYLLAHHFLKLRAKRAEAAAQPKASRGGAGGKGQVYTVRPGTGQVEPAS